MVEAQDLSLNPATIGYFVQLNVLMRLTDSDWGLRALSLFWFAVSTWALARWIRCEKLSQATRLVILLLWVTNPFLWVFAQQVRFYSFFVAATVLTIWRFREWQLHPTPRHFAWFVASSLLLCVSQFFSVLVLGALAACYLWARLGRRGKGFALVIGTVAVLLLFVPWVREQIILFEQRVHNQPLTPEATSRGINPALLGKLAQTFFAFFLGKRVYPLWLWITVPALLVATVAALRGLIRLRAFPGLSRIVILLLLELILVFLVADSLAPPSAPGMAARHVIFVLPAFIVLLGFGTCDKRWLASAAIGVQCLGLACMLFPTWSDEPVDLVDWKRELAQVIPDPARTYVLVDGRAADRVRRYLPTQARLATLDEGLRGCDESHNRILIVSNDHRLQLVRPLDLPEYLPGPNYHLVASVSRFPAHITVYQRGQPTSPLQLHPSRLDLPEQDLQLPLRTTSGLCTLPGFVRLDQERPEVEIAGRLGMGDRFVVASSYRSPASVPRGTPIAQVTFEHQSGSRQVVILRAGEETAAWDAVSAACRPLASWTKRAHLVGRAQYPGAYRQHEAIVWGAPVPPLTAAACRLRVRSLLEDGTVYFWGLLSADQLAAHPTLHARAGEATERGTN
jgi:hypothetical protein